MPKICPKQAIHSVIVHHEKIKKKIPSKKMCEKEGVRIARLGKMGKETKKEK